MPPHNHASEFKVLSPQISMQINGFPRVVWAFAWFMGFNLFINILVVHATLAEDRVSLEKLKEIEAKVQQVVNKTQPSCVSVTDGVGYGSGVIVNEDGLVLTAGHVIVENGPYQIILPSGQTVEAKALGKNLNQDIGMLQITTPGKWPSVQINRNRNLNLGEWVVALGHSGGFELGRNPPVRSGRVLSKQDYLVVTDAVLIGGDSGGPLFDLNGKLVGIHSSIGDSVVVNKHILVTSVLPDWDRLVQGESWGNLPKLNDPDVSRKRGKMGIRVDLNIVDQCVVKEVEIGKPADNAGLVKGDIILRFDNQRVKNGAHLIEIVKSKWAGKVYSMLVRRQDQVFEVEIVLN
ncbi:MAG: S1C family serine protease [Planctomycetota bacterium]